MNLKDVPSEELQREYLRRKKLDSLNWEIQQLTKEINELQGRLEALEKTRNEVQNA